MLLVLAGLLLLCVACVSPSPVDTSGTSPTTGTTPSTGTTPPGTTTPTGTTPTNPWALFDARMAHSDDGRAATSGGYGQVAWWDGTNWRIGATESGWDDSLEDVVFDGTRFVAVGGEPDVGGIGADYHVWESDDGAWWTQNGFTMDVKPSKLMYGIGVYLMLRRRDSAILRSTDRVSWTSEIAPSSDLTGDFGAGVFAIAVDPGFVRVSTDGQTWTDHPTGLPGRLQRLRYTDNGFAAYAFDEGEYYDYTDDVHYFGQSPDGITWTTTVMTGASWLWDIVWYDGAWYATPGLATVYTSTDGATWTEATTAIDGLYDLHTHDGLLYANGHWIHTSTDGVTWTQLPFVP